LSLSDATFEFFTISFLFGRAPHTPQQFQPSLRTNAVSCSSLRTNRVSEAISKGIPTTPYEIISKRQKMSFKKFQMAVVCSGRAATGFAIASVIPSSLRSSGQYRLRRLRIPHATHLLPLSLKKRGTMCIILLTIAP
jgi:hypothetical protein